MEIRSSKTIGSMWIKHNNKSIGSKWKITSRNMVIFFILSIHPNDGVKYYLLNLGIFSRLGVSRSTTTQKILIPTTRQKGTMTLILNPNDFYTLNMWQIVVLTFNVVVESWSTSKSETNISFNDAKERTSSSWNSINVAFVQTTL